MILPSQSESVTGKRTGIDHARVTSRRTGIIPQTSQESIGLLRMRSEVRHPSDRLRKSRSRCTLRWRSGKIQQRNGKDTRPSNVTIERLPIPDCADVPKQFSRYPFQAAALVLEHDHGHDVSAAVFQRTLEHQVGNALVAGFADVVRRYRFDLS